MSDRIVSKPSTAQYRENWERAFGTFTPRTEPPKPKFELQPVEQVPFYAQAREWMRQIEMDSGRRFEEMMASNTPRGRYRDRFDDAFKKQ